MIFWGFEVIKAQSKAHLQKKKVWVKQRGLREIISVNLHQDLPVQKKITEKTQ